MAIQHTRAMTPPEIRRLLSTVSPEQRFVFEFLVHTGIRWGECAELRWRDVHLGDRPRLRITRRWDGERVQRPKSVARVREVPLSAAMARRLRAMQERPERLVFTSSKGVSLRGSYHRRSVLKPAREAAGLPWVTYRTFRHTCASLLLASGMDMKQIQLWLGHHGRDFTLKPFRLMHEGVEPFDLLDEVVPLDEPDDSE